MSKPTKLIQPITESWLLPGATQDRQNITADWQTLPQNLIEGVKVKEVKNVPKENGFLTEVFRLDWGFNPQEVRQVFQVSLFPNKISAWHAHREATDRIFVNQGLIKLVLYDARREATTFGVLNEFRIGILRPTLVIIPPKIWHGVQNLSAEVSSLLNIVDQAYSYEDPDHWRLPWDTEQIPYSFKTSEGLESSSL